MRQRGGRLLLVLAHPDDEAFFCAGTAAKHVATGGQAALVSATRGENGTQPQPPVCPQAELGRVRAAELAQACLAMGVSHLTFLGYEDKRLAEADPSEAAARIADIMLEYRPGAVVTFGPDGIYGHPDHVAVSRLTLEAFDRVFGRGVTPAPRRAPRSDPVGLPGGPRLWHVATASAFWSYRTRAWVAAAEDRPPTRSPLPLVEGAPEAAIDIRAFLRTKLATLLCHRSQRHNVERAFGGLCDLATGQPLGPEAVAVLGREFFTLARGPRPPHLLEDSLL